MVGPAGFPPGPGWRELAPGEAPPPDDMAFLDPASGRRFVFEGNQPPRPIPPVPRDVRAIPALAWLTAPEHVRWVGWRYEWRAKNGAAGKWTKVPKQTNGANARTNDPATWSRYDPAWQAVTAGRCDGIAFMLLALPGQALAAIDLDDVRDPETGVLAPWAATLIAKCASYTEVTPSGCGLRVIGAAVEIATLHRKGAHPSGHGSFELYVSCSRCITVSGLSNDPAAPLTDLTGPIHELLALLDRSNGKTHHADADDDDDNAAPIDLETLSPIIAELILAGTIDGKPVIHPGRKFFDVARYLHNKGFTFRAALATLRAHPDGVAGKYGWRLETELHRAWQKIGPGQEADTAPVFTVHDAIPDETEIPARAWIAPGYLIRGAVTAPFGPADTGKSLLLIGWTVALALGRPWGRLKPLAPMRVLLVLAEEDDAEQASRFSAALRAFGVTRDEIEPRLRRLVVRDLATLLIVDDDTGEVVPAPGWRELCRIIEEFAPDVLGLDPLIEFHAADENNNAQLKAVIARFRGLAREYALAVILSHHSRKGAVAPGDLEPLRGASAIGGAVRFAFTLVEMTSEEADTFGISQTSRRYYLRLDRARGSYAPPATEAEWFEKHGYRLDNGDETPALIPWQPPEGRAPDQAALARLLTAIGQGCPEADGEPWSPQLRDSAKRSVRHLFRRHGIDRLSEKLAGDALKALGVTETRFRDARRKAAFGLRTPDGLPPALWLDEEEEAGQ